VRDAGTRRWDPGALCPCHHTPTPCAWHERVLRVLACTRMRVHRLRAASPVPGASMQARSHSPSCVPLLLLNPRPWCCEALALPWVRVGPGGEGAAARPGWSCLLTAAAGAGAPCNGRWELCEAGPGREEGCILHLSATAFLPASVYRGTSRGSARVLRPSSKLRSPLNTGNKDK